MAKTSRNCYVFQRSQPGPPWPPLLPGNIVPHPILNSDARVSPARFRWRYSSAARHICAEVLKVLRCESIAFTARCYTARCDGWCGLAHILLNLCLISAKYRL
jgi:hypothetical protein